MEKVDKNKKDRRMKIHEYELQRKKYKGILIFKFKKNNN